MAKQLVYTSAPQGLWPGTSGYCTVVSTEGIQRVEAEYLEKLSVYRILDRDGGAAIPPTQENYPRLSALNPSSTCHVTFRYRGEERKILFRTCLAGFDYSARLRKLSHFLVLDPRDLSPAGPAWMAQQSGVFLGAWAGKPTQLDRDKELPAGDVPPAPCRAWEAMTGDAGWAGTLAQTVWHGSSQPVYLIIPPAFDPLPLLAEAIALLPVDRRWDATFSSRYVTLPPGIGCHWRCVTPGSPEAAEAQGQAGVLVLDLTAPLGAAPAGREADAARHGRWLESSRPAFAPKLAPVAEPEFHELPAASAVPAAGDDFDLDAVDWSSPARPAPESRAGAPVPSAPGRLAPPPPPSPKPSPPGSPPPLSGRSTNTHSSTPPPLPPSRQGTTDSPAADQAAPAQSLTLIATIAGICGVGLLLVVGAGALIAKKKRDQLAENRRKPPTQQVDPAADPQRQATRPSGDGPPAPAPREHVADIPQPKEKPHDDPETKRCGWRRDVSSRNEKPRWIQEVPRNTRSFPLPWRCLLDDPRPKGSPSRIALLGEKPFKQDEWIPAPSGRGRVRVNGSQELVYECDAAESEDQATLAEIPVIIAFGEPNDSSPQPPSVKLHLIVQRKSLPRIVSLQPLQVDAGQTLAKTLHELVQDFSGSDDERKALRIAKIEQANVGPDVATIHPTDLGEFRGRPDKVEFAAKNSESVEDRIVELQLTPRLHDDVELKPLKLRITVRKSSFDEPIKQFLTSLRKDATVKSDVFEYLKLKSEKDEPIRLGGFPAVLAKTLKLSFVQADLPAPSRGDDALLGKLEIVARDGDASLMLRSRSGSGPVEVATLTYGDGELKFVWSVPPESRLPVLTAAARGWLKVELGGRTEYLRFPPPTIVAPLGLRSFDLATFDPDEVQPAKGSTELWQLRDLLAGVRGLEMVPSKDGIADFALSNSKGFLRFTTKVVDEERKEERFGLRFQIVDGNRKPFTKMRVVALNAAEPSSHFVVDCQFTAELSLPDDKGGKKQMCLLAMLRTPAPDPNPPQ